MPYNGHPAPLLTTKLFPPAPRPNLIARPRLTARLDAALRGAGQVVLVTAPPGFGKTTLLGDWIASPPRGGSPEPEALPPFPTAWIALDEHDNHPARFWTYVVAALQQLRSGLGSGLLPLLQSPQPPPPPVLVTTLVNEAVAIPGPFALVIDDYHVVSAAPIHEGLSFLVDHLPPQMRLVVLSRVDPPLPLARWRARGLLAEFRAADLRFTAAEAADFLNQAMGLRLAPEQVRALESRTEGWIAGLQLAALSLQGLDDAAGFIAAFSGSHRFVMDYLAEEVLGRQPEPVRRFLYRTCVLDRLCAPLCDAVLVADGPAPDADDSPPDSQAMLELLDRSNLFLVPLDDERTWYRYHHLFAEMLRGRLKQAAPPGLGADPAASLHRRASAWCEANGLLAEAIGYAVRARDFDRAAGLIEQGAEDLFKRGETNTLRRWIEQLPEAARQAHPRLMLAHAFVLSKANELEAAERVLARLETSDPGQQAEALAVRVGLVFNRGELEEAIALADRALASLPPASVRLRADILIDKALALLWNGDPPAADAALAEAVRLAEAGDNLHVLLTALFDQGAVHFTQGRLHQAVALYRRGLQVAAERQADHLPATGFLHADIGDALYEQNDLAGAAAHVREALQRAASSDPRGLVMIYATLARILHGQGDAAAAFDYMARADALVQQYQLASRFANQVAHWRVRLWLVQGDLEPAEQWARAHDLPPDGPITRRNKGDYSVLAAIRLAQGDAATALALAEKLVPLAEEGGQMLNLLQGLLLQAVARYRLGDLPGAQAALLRALRCGEPGGFVRKFMDYGPEMAELLQTLPLDEPRLQAYAGVLLAALAAEGSQAAPQPPTARPAPARGRMPLPEPLTDRELEVLRLIDEGLTNQEIALRLVIAHSTVKKHVNNIFGKLGAQTRTQALARARGLSLL